MLQPPVSTPTARSTAMPTSRMCWNSRSVSVIAGATVIESPVCTPIGSTFSIEQTTTTLSVAVPHQLELELLPAEHRLLDQHLVDGARRQTAQHDRAHLVDVRRRGRSPDRPSCSSAGRRPVLPTVAAKSIASSSVWQTSDAGTSAPTPRTMSLNRWRSSPAGSPRRPHRSARPHTGPALRCDPGQPPGSTRSARPTSPVVRPGASAAMTRSTKSAVNGSM